MYVINDTKTIMNFFDDDFRTSVKQKITNNTRSYILTGERICLFMTLTDYTLNIHIEIILKL